MSDAEGEELSEFLVFPTPEEEEVHKWTHQNTLIFLDLYKKYRVQVGSLKIKNLKKMFEEIAKEMQTITKTKITGTNCENRWKVLERNYKKYVDNSKQTGRERKVFEYAEIMHSILGKKRNIHPLLLLSSKTISTPKASVIDKENDILITEVVEEQLSIEENERQHKRLKTEAVHLTTEIEQKAVKVQKNTCASNKRVKFNIVQEIRSDRREYYKKRLEIEEKKLTEKVRKNTLLEKHNVLLEKFLEKNNYTPEMDH